MEKTQEQARQEILDLVADYCRTYHIDNKKPYKPGDRIPYASRVYDEAEMVNLVDSALEFWLTSGRYTDEFEAKLAEYLGVKKVIMMSGLPAGCPGDQTPVWITTSWPPETPGILEYQWNEVAIPKWTLLADMARNRGIEQIALENHGMQLVYNPETLLRLRTAIGPIIGMNLDPSHLFWMGGDPIEAARVLGAEGALYHIHAKDARRERRAYGPNGMLDTKPIDCFRDRSWNYVAVGAGHSLQWWIEFFSVVRMYGYNGDVALEMEDLTMPMLDGHLLSLGTLQSAVPEFSKADRLKPKQ